MANYPGSVDVGAACGSEWLEMAKAQAMQQGVPTPAAMASGSAGAVNSCNSPTGPAPLRVTYLGGLFTIPKAAVGPIVARFQTQFASFKGLKFCIPDALIQAVPDLQVVEISANQFNYLPGQQPVPAGVFSTLANESDGRVDLPWITNQNYIQVTLNLPTATVADDTTAAAFQGIAAG
jgi:hypothetical protein